MEPFQEFENILKYKGNEEEFKKYNEKLNEPFNFEIIYTDETKKYIKYKGQLKNGKYNGRGILYDFNYVYNGYFNDGKKEGYFQKYYEESKDKIKMIYEGFYSNDIYKGKGILYNDGKKIYEGYFINEKYNGIGIEYLPNEKKWKKMEYKDGLPLKECYGVLYDDNSNEIYKGKLKNERPEKGSNIVIFDEKGNKKYKGDFKKFKYNGKGILYYEKSNNIYYEGLFNMDKYENGILYDPKGNKIYEGKFIDNYPKECKNITFYELNGNIKFIGNFYNGKFNEYGKLYQGEDKLLYEGYFKDGIYEGKGKLNIYKGYEKFDGVFKSGKYIGYGKLFKYNSLFYEGEFMNNEFNGKGTLFYSNGQKYYEGNFKNGEPIGNGIKYYDNGNKKLEGIFNTFNSFKGKYYNPDNQLLYEGEIINEIPLNYKDIKIYNDYTYIIYERDLKEDENKGISLEYIPSYYIKSNITINNKDKNIKSKIIFLSFEGYIGKTTIIHSLMNKEFKKINYYIIGVDFTDYNYEFHDNSYIINVYDTQGIDRARLIALSYIKKSNVILIIFDLFGTKEFEEKFIEQIRDKKEEYTLIYLVGNKFKKENVDYQQRAENFRNYSKKLITQKKIDKYFEVDPITGEGIGDLDNNIKFDNTAIENKKETLSLIQKTLGKSKNNHKKKDCIIY